MKTYTAAQVREAEEPLLAAGVPLMARASAALAAETRKMLAERRAAGRGATAAGGVATDHDRSADGVVIGEFADGAGVPGPARVLVLAGSGNNGGDALFAAARLARIDGAVVSIVLTSDRVHTEGLAAALDAGATLIGDEGSDAAVSGAASTAAEVASSSVAATKHAGSEAATQQAGSEAATQQAGSVTATKHASSVAATKHAGSVAATEQTGSVAAAAAASDVILDGILGTGTSADPALRGRAREVVAGIRSVLQSIDHRERADVVAVDLPSGVGADDGAVTDSTVLAATVTVTFGGCKRGLLLHPAARYAGRVVVADIGLGAELDRVAARDPAAD
ncbi:NAD(P)H-hydrate epimerase [Subtercola sp. YIM 133946]|uniref:NAD(P)H-hydrate epimerase n=1 Tax=Subtercola sp. YIM 133946 TaxID=3118909 RepID=UPI002F95C927